MEYSLFPKFCSFAELFLDWQIPRLVYAQVVRMRTHTFGRAPVLVPGPLPTCTPTDGARAPHAGRARTRAEESGDYFHNGVVTNFLWFVLVLQVHASNA